jgi:FlaA1/EpsC-like NDP-sugar epimerase
VKVRKRLPRALVLRSMTVVHDTLMGTIAFGLSVVLRIGLSGAFEHLDAYTLVAFLYATLVGAIGLGFGLNRGIWRYASVADFAAIIKTITLAIIVLVLLVFLLVRGDEIPRSSVVIAWAFSIILLAIPRAAYRIYRDRRALRKLAGAKLPIKRVLLVGANDNADVFLKTIKERGDAPFEVLAIVDERGRRAGRVIRGVPVIEGPEELPAYVQKLEAGGGKADAIILTRSREEYQMQASLDRLVEIAAETGLELLQLPNLLELKTIDAAFNVRPIKVEDLLQRPVIQHEPKKLAALIQDRKVLITGAGGSIGSELAHQVAALRPSGLVLADFSEFLLYSIEKELVGRNSRIPIVARLCNVRERASIERLIKSERPDIVLHAAALKHVPMVEAHPLEGLFTNAIGTRNVAEACLAGRVKAMIMVSTDKAVNPTNVMGASKRMAEMFCQSMDMRAEEDGTRFVTVRFGNVLGSTGSVVPLFEQQIKAGGPVTVTHPQIERYFMSIPEACLLVLQAAAQALHQRNERGRIFVLDMGTPIKIVDLARNLIRLAGLRPDVDIRIVYTGLRPGEKLYEEPFASQEIMERTDVPGILAAMPRPVDQMIMRRIFEEMERLIEANSLDTALRLLCSAVSDFVPSKTISSLISGEAPPLGYGSTAMSLDLQITRQH